MANPRGLRRVGMAVSLGGAALGALGAGWRASAVGGGGPSGGTYLLDALGVSLLVAGAIVEGRAIGILADFFPYLLRQSVAHLVVGLTTALGLCLAVPTLWGGAGDTWVRTALTFSLFAGAGRALSGAAGVAIMASPGYLERRLEERVDEPW